MIHINSVNLIGRLVRDPEARFTANNTATTSFTIAVNKDFKRDGQPECDFINIVTWSKIAEFASKYFTKGMQVALTGKIQTRNWTDNNNQKHYVTEVVADKVYFADSKKTQESKPESYEQPSGDGFYPVDNETYTVDGVTYCSTCRMPIGECTCLPF